MAEIPPRDPRKGDDVPPMPGPELQPPPTEPEIRPEPPGPDMIPPPLDEAVSIPT
jgi:hypothetical protein